MSIQTLNKFDAVEFIRGAGFPVMRDVHYWDGNSLGAYSPAVRTAVNGVLDQWERCGIGGWTDGEDGWIHLSNTLARRLENLFHAPVGSIACTGSITSNLLNLLLTLHRSNGDILVDAEAFMTDRIVVDAVCDLLKSTTGQLVITSPKENRLFSTESIIATLPSGGTAILPIVVYTTGQRLDVVAIQTAAHARDCIVIWDAAHAVGVVDALPFDLMDAMVWCHYKWLNAGPGAVAGLYVHPRLHSVIPALRGWFGVDINHMFMPSGAYIAAPGAARFGLGTPHIFSLAALSGALLPYERMGIRAVMCASQVATDYLYQALKKDSVEFGWTVVTPGKADERGGHIAIALPNAGAICNALRLKGVIPDHRPPNVLRFAPPPWNVTPSVIDSVVSILKVAIKTAPLCVCCDLVP